MEANDIFNMSADIPGTCAARFRTPYVDTFQLPDDWRAGQTTDRKLRCTICHWNGRWDDVFAINPEHDRARDQYFPESQFEESALAGNLCCAAILAVRRKCDTYFDPRRSGYYRSKFSVYVRLYFSCPGRSDQAPPGTTAYPNGGHPSIEPRPEESLAWAKSRIKQCVTSHDCHTFRSKEIAFPTRLVYIPDDAQTSGVWIVKDAFKLPSTTRYAALSHCWGTETLPCLTTRENIDTYATEGISWEKIPLTFRDAMLYTRRLDLEYIWIDSMCIIQKDDTDWRQESTHMFQYYSHAYITLGSTFAADCNGGFFSQKRMVPSRLHLLDVNFRGEIFPLYIFRCDSQAHHLRHYEGSWNMVQRLGKEFQLFHRSWIFQERLVSPRLLYFTEKQLVFECYDGRWLQETHKPTKRSRRLTYKKLLRNASSEEAEGLWTVIWGAYGTLKITHAKDKLPAIAAVAKQFLSYQNLPHTPEDEYLCGLRKSHLHMDLSWCADFRYAIDFDMQDEPEPSRYLAPSWSWASIPQETTYDGNALPNSRKSPAITLMGEHVEFAAGDRFGQVLPGGYITVKGSILDCYWVFSLADFPSALKKGHNKLLLLGSHKTKYPGSNGDYDAHFHLDSPTSHHSVEGQVKDGRTLKNVTLLHTWTSVDGNPSKVLAIGFLVLHRSSTNGRYRRLGLGKGLAPMNVRQLESRFKEAGCETLMIE